MRHSLLDYEGYLPSQSVSWERNTDATDCRFLFLWGIAAGCPVRCALVAGQLALAQAPKKPRLKPNIVPIAHRGFDVIRCRIWRRISWGFGFTLAHTKCKLLHDVRRTNETRFIHSQVFHKKLICYLTTQLPYNIMLSNQHGFAPGPWSRKLDSPSVQSVQLEP